MIDTETAMLARLIGQADAGRGDLITLRAMAEEACELGAERALKRLGLSDDKARQDLDELRELLGAWRDAKRSAGKAAIHWVMRAFLALLLIGLTVRLGLAAKFL